MLAGMALVTSGLSALPAFAAGDFPREVTDALGRRVRIAAPPQRIVVVFPSNVELAWALGLEDRVAAIGGRVRWPESARAKPSIGGSLGYSAEAVAAYRPDLVVVTPSHYSALGLVEAFERVQVPSVVLAHPDLPSVFRNIELLGRATGTEEAARQLRAGMEARLQAVSQALDGAPRRSVYLETAAAARGAFQTMGTGHYANDALQWAGGRNVFADLQGSQQVSAEAIFVRDPDVIISLQQVPKDPALIAERPGWHSLRAVKNGRVVVLERSHKLIPGPRQIEAVEQYARALHPERFA
ncbi:MAG: ABC transporter substrate-binding protein [Variovorax sp. 67-131]|nr:MAG: ABC transporter substrate-binding protein [Variovorax sp. SCN 67-85]ODV27324.1 MAG: ABC transporter substrate-binding protein [Variovorax sp. SCN 67-20]OJZ11952.1 MAG: ABC transporter substrate-binding protein [Variovorax sp. 67-131]